LAVVGPNSSGTITGVPDRIATELLLIARSPANGRLRHRSALEKGLRAALFAELVFQGRLGDADGGPAVLDRSTSEDRILDIVLAAVDSRPRVAWRRWYHHVAADRIELSKQLVQSGRWTTGRDRFGRSTFIDADPAATLALTHTILQVGQLRQAPADERQAVLAVLTTVCGSVLERPKPRELRRSLAPLLEAIGAPSHASRHTVHAALAGCALSVRKRSRILS